MGFVEEFLSKQEEKRRKASLEKTIGGTPIDEIVSKLSGGKISYNRKVIDNVVVVMGAAGGVGTSTVVSNMAHMAHKVGLSVLVIDLNILYPTQHVFFGVQPEIGQADLMSCLVGKDTVGESIKNTDYNVSVLHASGRGIIDQINSEGNVCAHNLQRIISDVRPMFDLVIIESQNRVENTLINVACYAADAIYLVWDEGLSSVSNTERIRRNLAETGILMNNRMRVILNKRTSIYYSEYPLDRLGMELVGTLPFDTNIIENSLGGGVFCRDGVSGSKNSNAFYSEMKSITKHVLKIGGYVK